MNLSPAETERFYRIWWSLLTYVNARTNLVADFPKDPKAGSVSVQDAAKIRNALWGADEHLQGFVDNNPDGLPDEDMELAASWNARVQGSFYIMRHLKKHSIFLLEEKSTQPVAYGVVGLVSPIEEIIPTYALPLMVNAVLLPFEDRIIYDGLLQRYSISFGSGIRKSLTQRLRFATELGGLVTSLEEDGSGGSSAVLDGNKKILLEFAKFLTKSGLSAKMVIQHSGMVDAFVQTHLHQMHPPRSLLQLTEKDLDQYFAQQGSAVNKVSFKRLVKFLLETERIDWDNARNMEDLLKNK